MENSHSGIIGHCFQLKQLESDLATRNIAHAYLFVGPSNIGKFTIAKLFGQKILCADNPKECHSDILERASHLIHPDFLVLDRLWIEGKCEDFDLIAKSSNISQNHRSKARAKTDSISIDDIRILQERMVETGEGGYRVCLIRDVERMQESAANAFLKILEEPPEGRVFLLTARSLEILRPTLTSRTRVLRFNHVPIRDIKSHMTHIDSETAQFLLRCAQGAPGVILKLSNDPDALRAQRLHQNNALTFWRSKSLAQRLRLLEVLHQRSDESDQFLFHLALTLRSYQHTGECSSNASHALNTLVHGFETNVSRQLLTQQFALSLLSE